MKKPILIIVLTILFLNLVLGAYADVMPYYINSLRRYGVGFTNVFSPLVMRREPKTDGEILETLNFDYKGNATCSINKEKCDIDEIFAVYSESKKTAFMTTIDSTDGWNMVCFNQNQMPVCGWVEENPNKYYTTGEFFTIFGKKYGVFLFKDLQKNDKILYGAPLRQTNAIGSFEMPRMITPWLVRGNWLLVKVYDFNNQQKTGWINFRGDDGKLKLFVKF